MAKLRPDPIQRDDLVEFLETESDLAFEMKVLRDLNMLGFTCAHGGSYTDPVTKKVREFDIRATKRFDNAFLHMAVECKNLRPNYPLLLSCVPRHPHESFHEILLSVNRDVHRLKEPGYPHGKAMLPRSVNVRLARSSSLYKPGDPVGKSCTQVGKSPNGEIVATDSDIYPKWSQALSSADDLTYEAASDGEDRTKDYALSLVFPVLVIPDERLWTAQYDANGHRTAEPELVGRCSYYIHREYFHPGAFEGDSLTISHLEIVTQTGLADFVDMLTGNDQAFNASFPFPFIVRKFPQLQHYGI